MVCPQLILTPLQGRKWGAARSGGQRLLSPASDDGKKGQEPFLDCCGSTRRPAVANGGGLHEPVHTTGP